MPASCGSSVVGLAVAHCGAATVDGGAGEGGRAERCPGQPALLDDAGEHRKRRDAERDAHEEREARRRHTIHGEPCPEHPREAHPKHEWREHAAGGDGEGQGKNA